MLLNLFILAVIDVIETLVYVLIYGSTDTASGFVFGTWRRAWRKRLPTREARDSAPRRPSVDGGWSGRLRPRGAATSAYAGLG